MIVKCDGDRYAIPQVSLHELVRLKGEQLREGIETIHQAPVYRLRGNLIPLIFLRDQLGLEHLDHNDENATLYIVVLEANGRQFGLVVDDVSDSQEIVSKPLAKQLKDIAC